MTDVVLPMNESTAVNVVCLRRSLCDWHFKTFYVLHSHIIDRLHFEWSLIKNFKTSSDS